MVRVMTANAAIRTLLVRIMGCTTSVEIDYISSTRQQAVRIRAGIELPAKPRLNQQSTGGF
jgi:hypothetical protein